MHRISLSASQLRPDNFILDLGSDKADEVWVNFLSSLPGRTIFFDYEHTGEKRLKNMIVGDCRSLPFKNDTFDIICAVSFIEHIGLQNAQVTSLNSPDISPSGDLETLAECARVLKPEGKLILTVPMGIRSGLFSSGTARVYIQEDIHRFSSVLKPAVLDYYEYRLQKKEKFFPIGKENKFGTQGMATWQRVPLEMAQAKNNVIIDGILASVWEKYPYKTSSLATGSHVRPNTESINQKWKNNAMKNHLIIIGNSSAAIECYWLAQKMIEAGEPMEIKGFLSFEGYKGQLNELSDMQLGTDDDYEIQEGDVFCIGIGFPGLRLRAYEKWKKKGARFINLVHPKCDFQHDSDLGEANVYMANVFISSHVVIGKANYFSPNIIINYNAEIGDGNLFYSYVTIQDFCKIASCNQFGTQSLMQPKIKIGSENLIKQRANIQNNFGDNNILAGNPAKPIKSEELKNTNNLSSLGSTSHEKLNIDLHDYFIQLRQPAIINASRLYYRTEYRFVALFEERAKRAAEQTYDVIEKQMLASYFDTDQYVPIQQLKDSLSWRTDLILDLGVYKGASTRRLASIFPHAEIHGFDSFEGLPVNWNHAPKGAFGEVKGFLPDMPDFVTLHKGWFSDTLPTFRQYLEGRKICLLRIDCDVYESAKLCLDTFLEFCAENCIIIFDEYFGYFGFQEHEYKAFEEAKRKFNISYKWKAYGLTYALLQLTAKPSPASSFISS